VVTVHELPLPQCEEIFEDLRMPKVRGSVPIHASNAQSQSLASPVARALRQLQ